MSVYNSKFLRENPMSMIGAFEILVNYSPAKGNSEREGSEDEGPDFKEDEEEVAHERQQQQAVQVKDKTMDEPLGSGYRAARHHALELTELGAHVEFQGGLIYDHA
nr:hypothetical protein [Tanacetum cinerariifolium]